MAMVKGCFSLEKNDGYSILRLEGNLDYNNCKLFEEEIDNLSAPGTGHLLVHCEQIVAIPKDWLRALMRIHLNLKRDNRTFCLLYVNAALMSCLKKEGIDTTFKTSKDVKEALASTGIVPKRKLDTEFINPFLNATIHVLKVQAQVAAEAGQIFIKKPTDTMTGDISGIIGIISENFDGSVVISFPEQTFLKVISNMLGETYTKIDKEIVDGAGELTNMIFGQAKIVLNEKGYGIKTAIPSVVTGRDHSLSAFTKGPVVVVPFNTEFGKFFVEICLSH